MERNERGSWKSGIIFLVALVLLSAVAWVGWSLLNHRSLLPNNTVVSQAGITIGAVTPPKSLDIRSEDNDAVTQALLGMSIRPSWARTPTMRRHPVSRVHGTYPRMP